MVFEKDFPCVSRIVKSEMEVSNYRTEDVLTIKTYDDNTKSYSMNGELVWDDLWKETHIPLTNDILDKLEKMRTIFKPFVEFEHFEWI